VNLYLDASSAVKRYLIESGSLEARAEIAAAVQVATSVISRVEVTATLTRAARGGRITALEAQLARDAFQVDWLLLTGIPASPLILSRAEQVAWDFGLRGYDAVHLASALHWQEVLGEPVTVATFDRELWNVSATTGLAAWPPDLAAFIPAP